MTWVLLITAIVNGQVIYPDKVKFATKEACLQVLHQVEQHPTFKAYSGKASCEKAS
jgi:hypothetical protein